MTTQSALQKYARTVEAIKDHITENKAIFDAHQRLVLAEMDARNDLEDAASEEEDLVIKEPVISGNWRVVALPQEQNVYNDEKIKEIENEKGIVLITKQKRPTRFVISELKEEE